MSRPRSRWLGLGLVFLLTCPAAPALAGGPPEGPALLIHGNWCGLGDADRAAPVDALDAACRAHDLCYERLGRSACPCDRAFLRATARLAGSRRADEEVRGVAATAHLFFTLTPCVETRPDLGRGRKR